MRKLIKIIVSALCAAVLAVPVLATACTTPADKHVDYVAKCKLDFTSNTKKQEVTVRLYVDGDTTHFDPVSNSTLQGCNNKSDFNAVGWVTPGYAKARYLAINTPESTGQIEPYGSTASKFTQSKLKSATSIIIESDDDKWDLDSTGGRYLLWVWYMPEGGTDYRNLNIEILQAGLALDSNAADNRYGEYCINALNQAQDEMLYLYSGEPDPEYHYGGPISVTLKELRFNPETYANKKIAVEGKVVANFNSSAYIEETYYDIDGYEDGITIGMPVYYSYTGGKVVDEILLTGHTVKVVGVVKYYETGGYYQITDIKEYDRYDKTNPNNCEWLDKDDYTPYEGYTELNTAKFVSNAKDVTEIVTKKVDGEEIEVAVSKTYKEALLGTSVSLKNLTVTDVYTTKKEDSASKGAMTLTCKAPDNTTITVRTEVLYGDYKELMVDSDYRGKTVDVKGVVEYYDGSYQIKAYRTDYITVHRDDADTAQAAIDILKKLYNADTTVTTDKDFDVYGKINVDGTSYDVTWTAGANVSDYITIGTEVNAKDLLTVSVTKPAEEVEYTLTASVTVNGETKTYTFTRKLPAA